MAISLGNRAKMTTSTTGTGTISLGSALSGYQTFAQAGITNGQTVRYTIEDGANFEIGSGVYTSSGTTLTRNVTESSNSDSAISLSGSAEVYITASAADIFVNDGASTLTTTGVITGGTVEATSDTAAGDNAAMGYQSDDGLVLTGQGAVRDVTIKNDADATVISIPTGTTNVDFASSIDVANVAISTGVIDLKNGGSQSVVKFYCESSNAHYAEIKAPAHGSFSGNVTLTLPATTDTIAGIAATQTFTNKTLTAPKIADGGFIADANGNELVVFQTTGSAVNQLEITNNASGSNPILAATGGDTNIGIALTPKGTGEIVIAAGNLNYGGTAITATGADINLIDGITNGTVIASKAIITDSDKDISGGRNITISGELDAATGDFSGAVDIAGDLTLSAGADGALTFGAASSVKFVDNNAAALVFEEADNAYMTFVTTNSSEAVKFDKALDINGAVQLDATLTVGVDDTGYDVKFFGDTASAFMQWDASADDLILGGAAGLVLPKDKLTIDSTAVTTTAAELNKLDGAGTLKQAGKESIYVPAAAMYPSTTNPCSDLTQVETTALRPDLKVLDFAAAADDFAQFTIAFPKSWNEGTITFQPFWTVTGTDAGTVAWQLAAVAITSDESINTAFGTQVATTALAFSTTSNDLMVSVESGPVTIAGSPAANDMCFFQINRDTSADTQSGAARLVGIKLFFTTDAANDA
jgi:hypothetical protein